jgi:hypothetical protein
MFFFCVPSAISLPPFRPAYLQRANLLHRKPDASLARKNSRCLF